jgi:hypothetical protein
MAAPTDIEEIWLLGHQQLTRFVRKETLLS